MGVIERLERQWGYAEVIELGENHRVKHAYVNPGAALSCHRHEHRSENLVVVSGIADVRIGNRFFTIEAGQHILLPKGIIHRIENKQPVTLEIIEVWFGFYLDESDITRI